MVRGRRKCARNRLNPDSETKEERLSDAPKKKDSKLSQDFKGKLSHSSPQISTPPITKFFPRRERIVDPITDNKTEFHEDVKEASNVCVGRTLPRKHCGSSSESTDKNNCEDESRLQPLECSPHKIQLCEDIIPLSPSSALSQLRISQSPKRAVKSRRRLNPSQTANQQVTPKTVPKQNCCINAPAVAVPKTSGNHKLTEYFPVRRSVRKTKRTVLEEQQRDLEEAILSRKEEGLEVHNFEGKGRGVVTSRLFTKGEFVVEYAGELIDMCEAKQREKNYAQDQNTGCYMYYFKYKNNQYCVDATAETGRLGRLVNHSRNGNLITKTVPIFNQPHLVLIAKEDIPLGEEVTYDYGDRSKESIRYHPWLAS